jgi:hypothetical protein
LNDYESKLKDLEKQSDENANTLIDISNQFFSIQQKSYDLSNVYLSNVSTITDLSNDITRITPEIQNQAKLYALMQSDYNKKLQDVSAGTLDFQTASFYNYYDKIAADVWGQLSDNTQAINEGYSGLQATADDAINASLQDKRTLYNSILKQNNNMQSNIQKHTSDYNTQLQKNVYMDETIQEYDAWNQRFTVLYFVLLLVSIFILFRTTSFSLITKAMILILFIMYPWTIYPIEMALYTFFSYAYKYMIHQVYEKI